jgi:hypothetical protein
MTQVISACAALGYTVDRANELYNMIARIAQLGVNDFARTVDTFRENTSNITNRKAMRSELVKIILNNLAKADSTNFAESLAFDIKQSVTDPTKYAD